MESHDQQSVSTNIGSINIQKQYVVKKKYSAYKTLHIK